MTVGMQYGTCKLLVTAVESFFVVFSHGVWIK